MRNTSILTSGILKQVFYFLFCFFAPDLFADLQKAWLFLWKLLWGHAEVMFFSGWVPL